MPTKSRDDAVAITLMLHFEHDAFVGFVGSRRRFGNHAVEPRAFKATKPISRYADVSRCRSQMDWLARFLENLYQLITSLLESESTYIFLSFCEQIKENNRGGKLLGKKFHSRC